MTCCQVLFLNISVCISVVDPLSRKVKMKLTVMNKWILFRPVEMLPGYQEWWLQESFLIHIIETNMFVEPTYECCLNTNLPIMKARKIEYIITCTGLQNTSSHVQAFWIHHHMYRPSEYIITCTGLQNTSSHVQAFRIHHHMYRPSEYINTCTGLLNTSSHVQAFWIHHHMYRPSEYIITCTGLQNTSSWTAWTIML